MVTALGEFLQAARRRVTPLEVGLPGDGRRRVPGLRREEVATLAGVSVDYYVRLEQGRERSPSGAVAAGVGRALRLDEYGQAHLFRLAGLTPPRTTPTDESVEGDLLELINALEEEPALILGQAFDVIATNCLAETVFLGFPASRNLLESTFLVPVMRTLYEDWETVARNTVAGFRLLQAAQPDDPRIQQVLQRVVQESPEFRAMWADHLALGRRLKTKRLNLPDVGRIELHIQTFDVRASPGQELVVYRPDNPDVRRLLRNLKAESGI